tara:strand:+ start:643 stop:2031 length:1389 start_codon:yes stop_codon:yes gene_type:complete
MHKKNTFIASTITCLIISATQAQTAGYKFNQTRTVANATAGAAAISGDVTTMFNNPATMTSVKDRHFAATTSVILPHLKFRDGGKTNTNIGLLEDGGLGSETMDGGDGGNGGKIMVVPSIYGLWSVKDDMKIGLAVTSPWGLATEYDPDWKGRFHAIESRFTTFNINPNFAYRINRMWSIGLGVAFQYIDVKLKKKISNSSLAVFDENDDFGLIEDVRSNFTGNDWGAGFNVGLLFEPVKGTRLGLAYRSKITHGLRGEMDIKGVDPTPSIINGAAELGVVEGITKASLDLTTPETIDFSFAQDVGEAWTFLGSIVWTRWNRFNEINVRSQATGNTINEVERHGWKNVFMFSLGADWKFARDWVAHLGIAYDQSPISKAHRSPMLPGDDRSWLATGLDWSVADWAKISVSYTYIFIRSTDVDNLNGAFRAGGADMSWSSGNRLQGKFNSHVNIIGINANFKF